MNGIKALLVIALMTWGGHMKAQQNVNPTPPCTSSPFTAFGRNTAMCFEGSNIIFHSAAIAATAFLVQTDVDYDVYRSFSRLPGTDVVSSTGIWVGYAFPLVLGGALWIHGSAADNDRTLTAGCAVLQASLIASVCGTMLKAVTGRPGPDPGAFADMREASRTFRFGFLRGGVHYGWPSGHLMVNTAAVTSLLWFYPENHLLAFFGGTYLAYLAWGVLAHDQSRVHWFSDVVAGALMGYAIGSSVGRSFRDTREEQVSTPVPSGARVTPVAGPAFTGVSVVIPF